MLSIRAVQVLPLLFLPVMAHAAGDTCQMELEAPAPVRVGVLAPVAAEFAPALTQLGSADGVLAQSFDEALSVDNVLARIRIDGCRAMLKKAASALAHAGPDPAAYKPRTAFDNTPWRFNMTQNGKRMTADEFDAWMKARGVRVVGKKEPGADAAPAAAAPEK
ncbi:MAG: hypothetical protein J0I72_07460 [Stenotrophomonas sp.]|jgi:hypothetical protein|nr:hypothetical protein [Xanthomonadales bacterium]MBN8769161.1 hypothetical protein [Stenotrophomonas sp.]